MTISFSHRSVYYVPGTNCSLCLGIDRDSSRHLGGCNTFGRRRQEWRRGTHE